MEWWNDGILVFKRILAILILSLIPPVADNLLGYIILQYEIPVLRESLLLYVGYRMTIIYCKINYGGYYLHVIGDAPVI